MLRYAPYSYGEADAQLHPTANAVTNARRGIMCGDRNAMLQAALEAQGIALASEVFVANEIAAGRLVKVFDAEVASPFAIFAVCLPRRLTDPVISGAIDWLVREAQQSRDAYPLPAP